MISSFFFLISTLLVLIVPYRHSLIVPPCSLIKRISALFKSFSSSLSTLIFSLSRQISCFSYRSEVVKCVARKAIKAIQDKIAPAKQRDVDICKSFEELPSFFGFGPIMRDIWMKTGFLKPCLIIGTSTSLYASMCMCKTSFNPAGGLIKSKFPLTPTQSGH